MTKTQLSKLAKSKTITHCYIVKHNAYYRQNSAGYTDDICKAGVYTKEEAIRHAESCTDLYLVAVDVPKHNRRIVDQINELVQKII